MGAWFRVGHTWEFVPKNCEKEEEDNNALVALLYDVNGWWAVLSLVVFFSPRRFREATKGLKEV